MRGGVVGVKSSRTNAPWQSSMNISFCSKAIRKRQEMVNLCSSSPASNGGSIQKTGRYIFSFAPLGLFLVIVITRGKRNWKYIDRGHHLWFDVIFNFIKKDIIIEYKSNEYMLSYCIRMFKHCISYSLCKKCFKIIQKKNKGVGVGLGLEYWILSLRKDPFKDS